MVLVGTRDISALLEHAPVMPGFDVEAWRIEGVEILQAVFEIDDRDRESLVPPALHPTIPPAGVFSVARYPDSPVGPFLLAQVRVSCRAAALPRGFVLRAYASTAAATEALGRGWGYPCVEGDIRLSRYHDRIVGMVAALDGGAEILRVSLVDPEPINGGDIQYVAAMNLAEGPDGPVLVQVDADCTFHKAERGRPQVDMFDRAEWQAEGVDPVYPMNATYTTVDGGFPAIRFVMDPSKPAGVGTRKLR
jgi:hypothetical protein